MIQMGIGSDLAKALTKKKTNEYNPDKNYSSQIDRTNKWSDEVESLFGQISGREKFSYDMNNDAFYNQYAQQYANNAKLAMEDTVGQASALTGGYGNSYAATAGQAMYNRQMEGLNDRATQLYQLALQQYNAEGDRLNNLYSMAANAYGMEQDRIGRDIAEAQWNAEFDEQRRQYNLNFAYNAGRAIADDAKWAAGYAFDASRAAVSDAQWEKSFAYQADRDKVADSQWQQTFDFNAGRAAVSDEQFAQEMAYKYAALNKSTSSPKSKTMSKAEYERTIESLPNDLRLYLKNGATQVNDSDEVRKRRVTALKTAVERSDNAISEETAEKLLAYWGYDY